MNVTTKTAIMLIIRCNIAFCSNVTTRKKEQKMPLRSMKQKKFKGIYEYFRASNPKKVEKYYFSARDENNIPKKIPTNAKTPEEAKAKQSQYLFERGEIFGLEQNIPKTDNDIPTFKKLSDDFFDSRNTVNNKLDRKKLNKYAIPIIGKLKSNLIKNRELKLIQNDITKKRLSDTVNNALVRMVTQILRWGNEMEIIDCNIPKIKTMQINNNRERTFTEKEINFIFKNTKGFVRFFLKLLYYTGQRPRSILDLKIKDVVKTDNGYYFLIKGIKQQLNHRIAISDKILKEVLEAIEGKNKNDYLVSGKSEPKHYYTIYYHVNKLFIKYFNQGLDPKKDKLKWACFYTFRHTSLTNIYQKSGDIFLAQKIANHSSTTHTQRYAKVSDEQKSNAINLL